MIETVVQKSKNVDPKMRTQKLFADTGVLVPPDLVDMEITGVEFDSRRIKPGNVFFAMPGHKADGRAFAGEAREKGAVLVVAEGGVECGLPLIQCVPVRKVLAEVAAAFYGYPSRKLTTVGVTGTNGKTTVCGMIKSIFDAAGLKSALFGTLGYDTGSKLEKPVNTTPESKELQRLMHEALKSGCRSAVFEVSSHALTMYRVHAIDFDAGVFINLTSEHLDYHKTMENYFEAKKALFENLKELGKPAVVNISDEYGRKIADISGLDVISFGGDRQADVYCSQYSSTPVNTEMNVVTPKGQTEIILSLPGKFNVENALAAVATGVLFDIDLEAIKEGLRRFTPPAGRMQKLDFGQPFNIFIDYAHTPDGLSELLSACREFTSGKLITLFGCGGDKDRSKRAPMAAAVAEYSDTAVISSDNPRSEDPDDILDQVQKGFPKGFNFIREKDREKAIGIALKLAATGDTLILAGKGHEREQVYRDRTEYFCEEEIVRRYFENQS